MVKLKIWDQGIGKMDHKQKGKYGIKELEEWIMDEMEDIGWDQGIEKMDHRRKERYEIKKSEKWIMGERENMGETKE